MNQSMQLASKRDTMTSSCRVGAWWTLLAAGLVSRIMAEARPYSSLEATRPASSSAIA
jgi:hypothetical protein